MFLTASNAKYIKVDESYSYSNIHTKKYSPPTDGLYFFRDMNDLIVYYTSTPRNCFARMPTRKEITATLMLIPAISINRDPKG